MPLHSRPLFPRTHMLCPLTHRPPASSHTSSPPPGSLPRPPPPPAHCRPRVCVSPGTLRSLTPGTASPVLFCSPALRGPGHKWVLNGRRRERARGGHTRTQLQLWAHTWTTGRRWAGAQSPPSPETSQPPRHLYDVLADAETLSWPDTESWLIDPRGRTGQDRTASPRAWLCAAHEPAPRRGRRDGERTAGGQRRPQRPVHGSTHLPVRAEAVRGNLLDKAQRKTSGSVDAEEGRAWAPAGASRR